MSGRVGSITTGIIADGLIFNMDAANRASYVPDATLSYNTTDLSAVISNYGYNVTYHRLYDEIFDLEIQKW